MALRRRRSVGRRTPLPHGAGCVCPSHPPPSLRPLQVHTKAVISNPKAYEILDPEDFGVSRRVQLVHRLTGPCPTEQSPPVHDVPTLTKGVRWRAAHGASISQHPPQWTTLRATRATPTRGGENQEQAKFGMAKLDAEKIWHQFSNITGKFGTNSHIVAQEQA